MVPVPDRPKIYHITHVNNLQSIVADGCLWCEAEATQRAPANTTIGMGTIKARRLGELRLDSHPNLHIGDCVPFYFCPRSVMLYVLHQGNHPDLSYRDGQASILHLEADFYATVAWAQKKRWAFTTSNAGSRFFEDYADLTHLDKINWSAVQARDWQRCKDGKQAEFLLEQRFPWQLIERIGVLSRQIYERVANIIPRGGHCPTVEIRPDWYY